MYVPWLESDAKKEGSYITLIKLVDQEDTVYVYELETNLTAEPIEDDEVDKSSEPELGEVQSIEVEETDLV